MFTKVRNEKGFTLIELLIVVAIIGILAAIAIPQFAAYRIRGYNSAANSDIRNLKIAEEAFVTDWQVYASTIACAAASPYAGCTGAPGVGVLLDGPGNVTVNVAQYAIVATQYPAAASSMSFGLSSGVTGGVTTTAATGANYVAFTAHTQGDQAYGADSDNTQLKMAGKSATGTIVALTAKVAGTKLATAPYASVANSDDLTAALNWSSM